LSCDLPKDYEELIKTETGTTELAKDGGLSHTETAKINGETIIISLEKI
jgi:hypothetical protein